MGTTNHLGEQFSSDDLRSLLNDGHELASHTFSHISARAVSSSAYCDDVNRGRKSIEEIAGVPDSGNFAYPYGDLTLNTKRILGPTLRSSRSIFPGMNGPDVDLNLLLANSLYGGDDQIGYAQQLILENEKRKTWIIFYTHDVRSEPSRYGCTPSLLEATASFARKRGSQVLPVSTVLAEIGVTCPVSVPVASS
jgi:peptidoglycan/xylan/chitin deacetylase (PgdA/CDA1 family)